MRGATFRVLVASDGSIQAKRATSVVTLFPWPEPTRVRAVVARRMQTDSQRSTVLTALDRSADLAAGAARRALTRRWPDADVVIVDKSPADGVIAEAKRFGAQGSVAQGLLDRAATTVLVVR